MKHSQVDDEKKAYNKGMIRNKNGSIFHNINIFAGIFVRCHIIIEFFLAKQLIIFLRQVFQKMTKMMCVCVTVIEWKKKTTKALPCLDRMCVNLFCSSGQSNGANETDLWNTCWLTSCSDRFSSNFLHNSLIFSGQSLSHPESVPLFCPCWKLLWFIAGVVAVLFSCSSSSSSPSLLTRRHVL